MVEFIVLLFIAVLPFALILNARKRGQRQRLEARRHRQLLDAARDAKQPPTQSDVDN